MPVVSSSSSLSSDNCINFKRVALFGQRYDSCFMISYVSPFAQVAKAKTAVIQMRIFGMRSSDDDDDVDELCNGKR